MERNTTMGMIVAACLIVCVVSFAGQSPTVNEAYPGLASGALTWARLSEMPSRVLFRSGNVTITERDVADEIAEAHEPEREQLRKNAFYVLERMATDRLLLVAAEAEQAPTKKARASMSDRETIQAHLGKIRDAADVKVSDAEVREFYEQIENLCGGAAFDQIRPQIVHHLREQGREHAVDRYIAALGQRMSIEVSAAWTKRQAVLANDNPVAKARSSGKASLVVFSGKSCCGPDRVLPLIDAVREKYGQRVNVVYVEARQEQILATRHHVRSIPTLIFYAKDGAETFRREGSTSLEEIEKKLVEIGVK